MIKKTEYATYKGFLNDELKGQKLALNYLNEALKDEDEGVFLVALKDVLTAQGLDKTALEEEADRTLKSFLSIIYALGYDIVLKKRGKRAPVRKAS